MVYILFDSGAYFLFKSVSNNYNSRKRCVLHLSFVYLCIKVNGHKEDILSIAVSPPNLLATSSYDGEVQPLNSVS